MDPTLILHNGQVTTLDRKHPEVEAVAIEGGRIAAVGTDADVLKLGGPRRNVIDLGGRRVIPGLNDSHLHLIRGGLNYNMELRWDGVPSLADALRMLKEQARRTPPPQWVRVVGGWTEFQFAERRMPTLDEINAASPDTPVFVLHLYCRAMLNAAALRACGYTKDTPNPPGGEIQRDKQGNPTGLLIARPNAMILYATLAKGPKLPPEHQMNSTRHFMRELNRLGLTSAIDAGGGFQNYPEDYAVIEELHKRGEMTVRIAYNLFTQSPKQEMDDFAKWVKMTRPGEGSDFCRMNGAGEMLAFSAADFEDFLEPRPDLVRLARSGAEAGRATAGRTPLAVPSARDLRRDDQPLPQRVRGGQPRRSRSTGCAGSSITPRRSPTATWNACGPWAAASRSSIAWPTRANISSTATEPRPPHARRRSRKHAGAGHSRRRRDRRHARGQLQPLGLAVLDGGGQNGRRHAAVSAEQPAGPRRRLCALHAGERLVLERRDEKGGDRRRPIGRSGRAVGGLFLRCRGGDQRHRIGADGGGRQDRLRSGRFCDARPAAAPRRARLVAGEDPSADTINRKTIAADALLARSAVGQGRKGLLHALLPAAPPLPSPLWDLGCDCFAF